MPDSRKKPKTNDASAQKNLRAMWKGAISFGLVHIPVAMYAAATRSGVDFDWLDKRTMDPVGYKRINKKTGKEVAADDIVKGVELDDGQYVVLSADEIRSALPESVQTIEIESFIQAHEVPFVYLERPYYLAPINRGKKVYALLREALLATERVGIARIVIQSKQHLAVLIPCGPALVLNLLRWGGEIRSFEALELPPAGVKAAGIKEGELKMANELIKEMSQPWNADEFRDSFKDEIMRLVRTKAQAGKVESVEKMATADSATSGAEIIDLTKLLKRSLQGGGKSAAPKSVPGKRRTEQKPVSKKTGAGAKTHARKKA